MRRNKIRSSKVNHISVPLSGERTIFWQKDKALQLSLALRWRGIVGDKIFSVTSIDKIAYDVLYVACSSSVWSNELTLLKDDIIKKVNLAFEDEIINDIRFSTTKYNKKYASTKKTKKIDYKKIKLDENEVLQVENTVKDVKQPELADKIKQVYEKMLKDKKITSNSEEK